MPAGLPIASETIITDHPNIGADWVPLGSYVQLRPDIGRAYAIPFRDAERLQRMGAKYVPALNLTAEQRGWLATLNA